LVYGSNPDPLYYWEGALYLLFYKLCLKMINHGSRSTWGPGPSGSRLQAKKCDTLQQKHWCVLHLKFYYVFTKTHGCRATPSHFGPHYPWFCVRAKSRKLRRDLVDLWEGTLQLYYNNLSLKMIDRGSRSTWGPSP